MNVIIKIKGREAIPVRALPLLAEWGTMNPENIAGALGRVTDDDRRPLFEKLHDMNAFYVEDGTVHPVAEHHWRDHTYRRLKALSATIKHTEINHENGHSEWRVKAVEMLPKDAFVWKDEYEPIYNREYGSHAWANFSADAQKALTARGKEAPPALKFSPRIADERMEPLVQAALDAIGMAANTRQQVTPAQAPEVEQAPITATVVTDGIDFTMVATRKELIDAFDKFTGMDKSWFDNLTTSPKLMAARKFTGQGGRQSAEPLFCPYEVMQWLADPKRKKGKPLNDTTAWRLLKSHFPKVHNQYSIGDPNTD